ncbi:hypothetical protein ACWDTT_28995, partial [Streptosporangium sandarakinum]
MPAVRPSAGCPAARWRVGGPPPASVSGAGTNASPVPASPAATTDYDAAHVLLRTVRCVSGEMQVTLDCEPVFD